MQWGFSPGFRFQPSDSELFCHYLCKKIAGTLLPIEQTVVMDCDLYGVEEPWQVWKRFGGSKLSESDDLYFFTKLKKKCDKGSRIDRTVGTNGTWQGEDQGEKFEFKIRVDGRIQNHCIQGLKKRFRYENSQCPEQHGRWIMHEFRFPDIQTDWVLCRLRKNERHSSSSSSSSSTAPTPKKKRKLEKVEYFECESSQNQETSRSKLERVEIFKSEFAQNGEDSDFYDSNRAIIAETEDTFTTSGFDDGSLGPFSTELLGYLQDPVPEDVPPLASSSAFQTWMSNDFDYEKDT